MKTLNPHEEMTLKDMISDMDNQVKHQALLEIINHIAEHRVLDPLRLKEIIDAAKKYNDILKKK